MFQAGQRVRVKGSGMLGRVLRVLDARGLHGVGGVAVGRLDKERRRLAALEKKHPAGSVIVQAAIDGDPPQRRNGRNFRPEQLEPVQS